jgi:hypothetical protein
MAPAFLDVKDVWLCYQIDLGPGGAWLWAFVRNWARLKRA